MSYENKMMQLKQMLGKKVEKKEKPTFIKPKKPDYIQNWVDAGLTVVENEFGVLFKRQVDYPFNYKHGNYELKSFFEALEKWRLIDIEHPYSIDYEENVLFFDTETTGLKGVGTNIFLMGFIEAQDDKFVLTQYVLADPSNEAAFLFESKLWQPSKTIVTYNGKSFDWPQLETRWTLNKQTLPKLQSHRQIDLLHSSKRIWKNNLDKMKLTQVEEKKLGFTRKDDIPGFLAPIIYLDAIKSGEANNLMKVLDHNEWDLLSLITLYIHSTELLLEEKFEDSALTYTNIGKWYGDLKQGKQSETLFLNVTNNFEEKETGLAHYYLACQLKRKKQYEEAATYFEKSLNYIHSREKLKAIEQLAILYEHQFKQYQNALDYAKQGIEFIDNVPFMKREQKMNQKQLWIKRIERIEQKSMRKLNNNNK